MKKKKWNQFPNDMKNLKKYYQYVVLNIIFSKLQQQIFLYIFLFKIYKIPLIIKIFNI